MSNDNFVDAYTLPASPVTDSVQAGFDPGVYTRESGEPASSVGGSAWWKIIPATGGRLILDTTLTENVGGGGGRDTLIYVYTGTALNNLTEVDYNDDGGPNGTSILSVPVIGGTPYYIQVGSYGTVQPNVLSIVLRYTLTPPPPPALPPPERFTDGTVILHDSFDRSGSLVSSPTPNVGPAWQFFSWAGQGLAAWFSMSDGAAALVDPTIQHYGPYGSFTAYNNSITTGGLPNQVIQMALRIKFNADIPDAYYSETGALLTLGAPGVALFTTGIRIGYGGGPPRAFISWVAPSTNDSHSWALDFDKVYTVTSVMQSDRRSFAVAVEETDADGNVTATIASETYTSLIEGAEQLPAESFYMDCVTYAHQMDYPFWVYDVEVRVKDGPVPDAPFWTDFVTTTETVAA